MTRLSSLSVLAVAALALAVPGALAQEQTQGGAPAGNVAPGVPEAQGSSVIAVKDSPKYGQYLTDAGGRTLYMFTADTQGHNGNGAKSACTGQCAVVWPPLVPVGKAQATQESKQSLVGTFDRPDGKTQITYNGWPLYYFKRDQGAGQVTGQDKHGFGGEWYLMSPSGHKISEESGGSGSD